MKFYLGPLGTVSFLLLAICIVLNIITGLGLIIRKDPNKRADFFYSILLFAFAFTALHHVLILQGMYSESPQLIFLPIYFTLTLGFALFFSVKLRIFPNYKFVGSDSKHFILPFGQFLYFAGLFAFTSVGVRYDIGRKFYSPFYGGLEMALYIGTFHAYLFGAYRYIRFKLASLRHEETSLRLQETLLLRKLVRVMVVLFWINSIYIIADFVMYELLRLNMHDLRGFTRFGELSFAAMALWAGWIGWKLLTRQPYKSISLTIFSFVKMILLKGISWERRRHKVK